MQLVALPSRPGVAVNIQPQGLDDSDLNRELAAAMGDLKPEEMLQAAPAKPRRENRGHGHGHAHDPEHDRGRIQGTVVGVRGQDVLVDIGGKSEAFISLEEFDAPPQVGETHHFVSQGFDRESGLMRLSLREAKAHASWDSLKVGDVVEGRVTGQNIGGLELDVKGIKAFMPKSQVDVLRHENFAQFLGHKLECEVTEIDRRGKRLLLSHRRVLERKLAVQRDEIKGTLAVGQKLPGTVKRLTDFGAFVDIGGIDGLLHVSDISWSRVNQPADVLKVGEQIEVQILKIDPSKDRISLGRKQLSPDPWTLAATNYRVGEGVDARVTKLMEFGAFAELEPGIEGLIPVSEISYSRRINHPREVLKEGDSVRVSILAVDGEKRKITLSLKALMTDPWANITEKYQKDMVVSGAVMRTTNFGAFIQLEEGVEGLAHISELSDKRISTPAEVVKPGQVVQCRVLGVDPAARRISLSLRQPPPERPAAPTVDHSATHAPADAAAAPAKSKKKRPMRGGLWF